jgi:pimeloyl-ACP methyl ester carboxylesterase
VELTPADADLPYSDLEIATDDGERVHGWWIRGARAAAGHVLLCHGNAGNVGDRVLHAALLTAAGFDVLLFDYRGYGRSSGRPSEDGTYRDARAARAALLEQPRVDAARVLYLGSRWAARSRWRSRSRRRRRGSCCSRPSRASATWRGGTIRSSRGRWCQTPTRASRGSAACESRCW